MKSEKRKVKNEKGKRKSGVMSGVEALCFDLLSLILVLQFSNQVKSEK